MTSAGNVTATTFNGNTLTTGSSTYTGTAAAVYTFPAPRRRYRDYSQANVFTISSAATSPSGRMVTLTRDADHANVASQADGGHDYRLTHQVAEDNIHSDRHRSGGRIHLHTKD